MRLVREKETEVSFAMEFSPPISAKPLLPQEQEVGAVTSVLHVLPVVGGGSGHVLQAPAQVVVGMKEESQKLKHSSFLLSLRERRAEMGYLLSPGA